MADQTDEPSVIGAGCGLSPIPTRAEAEAVWRQLFAARLVERDVLDADAAEDCARAVDVDLSVNPQQAADDEIEYWGTD